MRRLRLYVVGAALSLAAYLAFQFHQRELHAQALDEVAEETSVFPVTIVHATPAATNESITLPGNIEAWYQAPIYARVSGYVASWRTDFGALVSANEVLAVIDTPMLEAQLRQARADAEAQHAHAELAELTAHRFTAMRDSHAVSEQQISVQEAEARVAEAEYEAALQNVRNFEAQLRFRFIRAPYDGVVISRHINVGDYVTHDGGIGDPDGDPTGPGAAMGAGTNLFTVADIHRMRLFVSVPESFGPFLHEGLTADVTVPQFPERHFTAQFVTVAGGFGTDTRTAVTEFVIENEDRALWPGSYATVQISIDVERSSLEIPSTALVFDEHGTQVATVTDDSHVHFEPIRVTRILNGTIDVLEGVHAEDRIIDHPSAALLEGDEVRIVTPAAGYGGAAEGSVGAEDEAS
jgi:multidrug efflux pump subunit AcrA (membrane-fusion protein)